MANTGFLDISDLSFNGIKTNIKSFMQAKTEFKDYDFEGSNLSSLLDVLSYNTYMNAFYLNMIGSEMFIDSSQMRNSIVSHAKELNYLPRSRTSARALVTFSANPGTDQPDLIVIPEGYPVRATVDNVKMDFTTDESVVLYNSGGQYVSDQVYIYEGKIVTEFFNVSTDMRYCLQSTFIDTNSIKVTVIQSSQNSSNTGYQRAENLYGLTSSTEVYFVQGYKDNQYEIVFGDGISGKKLTNGNIVKVQYRSTHGEQGNKASSFTPSTKIYGLYPVTVTTVLSAADGSERETNNSIKFNAPRHYAAQNRAVTKDDYTILIKERYPEIMTVNVYGGEDSDPPQYGKVILNLIPYGRFPTVSNQLKNDIIAYLKGKNFTVEPIIEEPDYLYVDVNTHVSYNPSLTIKSMQTLKAEIKQSITNYAVEYLNEFGADLRKSKLMTMIDQSDTSIVSNDTTLSMVYKTTPVKGTESHLNINFSNKILRNGTTKYTDEDVEVFKSSSFTYYDIGTETYKTVIITDDNTGNLRMYYTKPNPKGGIDLKVVVDSNIGTIDYNTGKVDLYINPYDYDGYVYFYATPKNSDVVVQQNKYIKFNTVTVTTTEYAQ